jgi:hypothetical protein
LFFFSYSGADIPAVAFSAGLTRPLNLTHSETVIYDRVFVNIGSGYDSSSGKFRCPQGGIYVFQFHALSKQVYIQHSLVGV